MSGDQISENEKEGYQMYKGLWNQMLDNLIVVTIKTSYNAELPLLQEAWEAKVE